MRAYVVKQGDYLTKLAYALGFSADAVWNDAKNADLKASRPDPDLLAPGDVLYLPDAAPDDLPVQSGTSNDYAAAVPLVSVHLVLAEDGVPLADEPYIVEGHGEPTLGTTGGDGAVSLTAPITLRELRLTLPQRGIAYAVRIGDLDPITEASGVSQRVKHLGFEGYAPWTRADGAEADGDVDRDRRAVTEFQRSRGLPETGEADDATREALIEAHGS